MTKLLAVGDTAPNFRLATSNSSYVSLADFLGKKNVVVYFYPKDFTQGCTAEACSFRDSYESFKDLGAEVIGISSDGQNSHRDFAQQHHLPFILLSDADGGEEGIRGQENTRPVCWPRKFRSRQERNNQTHLLISDPGDRACWKGPCPLEIDRLAICKIEVLM